MTYSKDELLKMYYHLARGRIFTLKMHDAVKKGYIRSSFHTPYGQEAVSVGIACAMDQNDWFAPTHRDQCASIMRFDAYQFIAEIFGKSDGMHKGISFDFHCSDYSEGVRMLGPVAILGGAIPTYTGFAWSLKQKNSKEVVVVCQGDGGCSEGAAYEGWNLAALYKVPVVFVIENNKWAMTVPLERQSYNPVISEKAKAIGLQTQIVDGNDILAVREAADKAIAMARDNKPNVIEINTTRWEAHFFGQGNDYRGDLEEVKASMENDDCLKNYEKYLLDNSICTQEYMNDIKKKIGDKFDEMIERAANAAVPSKEEIYVKEHIYATPETGGEL